MTDEYEKVKAAARAICRVQLNGGDPDQPAMRWNGTEAEPQEIPAWQDYRDEARAAVAALDVFSSAIEREHGRVCRAIGHYASHAPLDLKSPREIQHDLFAICGEPHVHVASIGSDECDLCGRDLRHETHARAALSREGE